MDIKAKVIECSIYEKGPRLVTAVLRYPRYIHAQLMTHRVFSRNASSSRAKPVSKLIEEAENDPVIPFYLGKNQKGMQAREEIPEQDREAAIQAWLRMRDSVVKEAKVLSYLDVHKQTVNRALEPWTCIDVIVTSTKWANFFALRTHEDAQPEIIALANKMYEAYIHAEPKVLKRGEWHLPFVNQKEAEIECLDLGIQDIYALQKISAARCARVSYSKHDGTPTTVIDDFNTYNKLIVDEIKHGSAMEHQARVPIWQVDQDFGNIDLRPELISNLKGWVQYRKLIPGEYISSFKDIKE